MNISFSDLSLPKSGTLALYIPEGATLKGKAAELDDATGGALSRAMAAADFSGKKGKALDILAPAGVELDRVILVGAGNEAEVTIREVEKAGADIFTKFQSVKDKSATVIVDGVKGGKLSQPQVSAHLAFGLKLRSYKFDRYKTKKKDADEEPSLSKVTVMTGSVANARKAFAALDKVADGMFFARDLVSEPPNILYPAEFAKRLKKLSKSGLKVEVLGETQMEKLGMGALLGVGQGSVRESQLVVMSWMGGPADEAPIAFVGKGVCFDTGGISLKPAAGMEDMKGDMGGAAAVSGLMLALAERKAKANVIGVVGLVENMPDGGAIRPGDILTSLSGQTIEVINTDAEGRLVLADALWYTQDKYKPKLMVDLATLTGAILVSLGKNHAGLFSNDDKLAEDLTKAGLAEDQKLWRLPMGPAYDKLIDSKFADMKNTGGRDGGSITAAQFLERYVNKLPWAHLDIAAITFGLGDTAQQDQWEPGSPVRLLNRFVADNYES